MADKALLGAWAHDMNWCDWAEAFGRPAIKRKARAHRKNLLALMRQWNKDDGIGDMPLDELDRELEGLLAG